MCVHFKKRCRFVFYSARAFIWGITWPSTTSISFLYLYGSCLGRIIGNTRPRPRSNTGPGRTIAIGKFLFNMGKFLFNTITSKCWDWWSLGHSRNPPSGTFFHFAHGTKNHTNWSKFLWMSYIEIKIIQYIYQVNFEGKSY